MDDKVHFYDTLHIRDIETDVVRRAKAEASLQGMSLKSWILDALEDKLRRGAGIRHTAKPASGEEFSAPEAKEAVPAKLVTEADTAKLLADAQKRLEEKRKAVQAAVPEMKRAVEMTDRALLAFREKYSREPKSAEELELFKKRGW